MSTLYFPYDKDLIGLGFAGSSLEAVIRKLDIKAATIEEKRGTLIIRSLGEAKAIVIPDPIDAEVGSLETVWVSYRPEPNGALTKSGCYPTLDALRVAQPDNSTIHHFPVVH